MSPGGPFVIEPDDPCLDGHFPGNPLVPAVVILDIAAHALEKSGRAVSGGAGAVAVGTRVVGLVQAKFSTPLRPGEPLMIDYRPSADQRTVAFHCRCGERAVAEGLFQVEMAARP